MLCSPLKVNWHFGGTYCLHLRGQRVSQAKGPATWWDGFQGPFYFYIIPCLCKPLALLSACFMLVSCLAYASTLKVEGAVKTSNPTKISCSWD
jgi:hypothetical protein